MTDKSTCSSLTGSFYNKDNSLEANEQGRSASFAALKLFGRTEETAQLREALHGVMHDHTTRIVAVHGDSGMGKTCLVESLREKVVDRSHGYFCSGKFFQNSTHETYSAIMAAFSDLCDLVVQAGDFEQRKEKIRAALGSDGYILAGLISSIGPFLPPEKENGDEYYERTHAMDKAALTRFRLACKNFLRAMSHEDHPIVLFIDDLQWADEGSRLLISTLLEDDELRHVLFVLAYREEESKRAESLLKGRRDDIVDIQVGNLTQGAIEELLSSSMGSSSLNSQKVSELSKLVKSKTQGHPFHVCQYLEFIHAEGLLAFSRESSSWEFDVGDIQQQTMVPESLVEILGLRIDRLPLSVLQTLMVAAFLGFSFEERILVNVMMRLEHQRRQGSPLSARPKQDANAPTMVNKALNQAVREGIVEVSTTPGHYLFSHDKLLSSFCTRNQDEHGAEASGVHFVIAQCYVDLKGVNDGEYAYRAAQHANEAASLFEIHYGASALVGLNLEAADYCMKRSVFYAAAEHLREGVELLARNGTSWEKNYELCLMIHDNLAEVEMILGNFKACRTLTTEVLYHGKSQEAKVKALWNQISVKLAENQVAGSIQAGREALKDLDVSFPVKVNVIHVMRKLFRVKRMLRTKSDDRILKLPMLNDTCKIAIHRVLVHIAVMSIMEDQEACTVYAALMLMEKTLAEGLSQFSSTGIAIYALAEASLGNIERAYRYGQLALTVAKTVKCVESESATVSLLGIAVLHWKQPVGGLVEPFSRAFSSCFSVGNLWYGSVANANNLFASLVSGGNLIELEGKARYYLARFKEYNQEQLAFWTLPILQCVLNLTMSFDNWRDATTLTGDVIVENDFFHFCDQSHYIPLKYTVLLLKLILAYHFRYYDVAEQVLQQMTSSAKVMRMHYVFYTYHFFAGMSYIALFREKRKKIYLKKARYHKKQLQNLRVIKCPNSEPLVQVLLAEELSLTSSYLLRYETAVATAAEACTQANLMQHAALVYERAGFVHAEHKQVKKAEECFDRAMSLYDEEWGSKAKYDWLSQERQTLLKCSQQPTRMWGLRIEVPQTQTQTA